MRLLLFTCCTLVSCAALAAPPVYRCENNGRVAYSDAPCVGAKVIDATPTQGMDKMSGATRKGADVQRADYHTILDDAVRPLTGKSHEQMSVLRRRNALSTRDQGECARLDRDLPVLEGDTAGAAAGSQAKADARLYQARKLFFDLKC